MTTKKSQPLDPRDAKRAADGFTERRNYDGNRRASGWRWGVDRRKGRAHPRGMVGRQQRVGPPNRRDWNRRRADRDE